MYYAAKTIRSNLAILNAYANSGELNENKEN